MSGNAWKFVGGPEHGRESTCEPMKNDDVIWLDGFLYVVRHHDRILLFHPQTDEMIERAALKVRERSQV